MLAAAGTEKGGCEPAPGRNATGGQIDHCGDQPFGRCQHTTVQPVLAGGRIVAEVDVIYSAPVAQHRLTVTLLKRAPGSRSSTQAATAVNTDGLAYSTVACSLREPRRPCSVASHQSASGSSICLYEALRGAA